MQEIDDGIYYAPSDPNITSTLIELPGNQHAGACGITFADGHAEIHKWRGAMANEPVKLVYKISRMVPKGDPDLVWLANHTAAR